MIVAPVCAAIHERHVASLDKAHITEALPECVYAEGVLLLSPATEHSDHGYWVVCPRPD